MNDSIIEVFNKVLFNLQAILPQWAFVAVLIAILLLTVLAAIPLLRSYFPSRRGPPDLRPDYRGATIHVNVQKDALGCNAGPTMHDFLRYANMPDLPGASHYAELNRIAALVGDDDEELTIS